MIKTREQLLDELERETLARVRDVLRRGGSLFSGTPDWDPPKEPSEEEPGEASTENAQEWADFAEAQRDHASELEDYAKKIHDMLDALHNALVDFESDAARALIDFDKLTAQYNVERLPASGS